MGVEYFVRRITADPTLLTDELDERVKEGWRLVTVASQGNEPDSGNETVLLFLQREKESNPN